MANATTILPAPWPIKIISGTRVPPLSFKVVDFAGSDFTDYIPSIEVHRSLDKPAVQTLNTTLGLSKTGAVTTLNLTTSLSYGQYRWFGTAALANGWLFPLFADFFEVVQLGRENGSIIGLDQKVFKLPILPGDVPGAVYLVDDQGNRILDDQGNFILL